MSRVGLLLALIFSSAQVFAVGPAVAGVSGASGVDLTGQIKIYGAVFGTNRSDTICTGDGINPCSTCTASSLNSCGAKKPLCVCSTKLVYDTLQLQITIKNPPANSPKVYLAYSNGSSYTRLGAPFNTGSPSVVNLEWQYLCKAIGSPNCANYSPNANNLNGTLNAILFYDKDNDGAYSSGEEYSSLTIQFYAASGNQAIAGTYGINSFLPFPGDEKIYITEPDSSQFPSLEHGGRAVATRVFLSTAGMDLASPLSDIEPRDLPVSTTGSDYTSNIVDGLSNGNWYYVRLAQVDEAGNIVNYFPDLAPANCNTPDNCPYAAKPDQVLGLLSQDMNCFVATAAYGSSLAPELTVFRDFRYKVLLKHSWGVKFVKAYYHYGPYAARYISDKPFLRGMARAALWPAYAFSYLALKFGFASACALALLLLTTIIALPQMNRQRMCRRD